jgi:hypothetical protein
MIKSILGAALLGVVVGGCSSSEGAAPGTTGGGAKLAPPDDRVHGGVKVFGPYLDGDCDPIVPTHCGYPFPSDVYLIEDSGTKTGRHVEFGPTTLPANVSGVQAAPNEFRNNDGFSPGAGLMTHMPGATVTGLATPLTIPESLEDDSPTVLIEADTGKRVPHFSELDMTDGISDDERAFIVRPVVRLNDSTRYIVAIRNVVDGAGKKLQPSAAFKALRDGTPHDDPSIEKRRELYSDMFARLDKAGVAKDDLQIAWDVTTASRENNTAWMLHIRDEALKSLGPDGPAYTIDRTCDGSDDCTKATRNPSTSTKLRIEGKVTVPLFLDKPDAGGKFVLGPDGMPEQNGTAEFPFVVLIPISATEGTPGIPMQNGHGLFGTRNQVTGFADAGNQANWIMVATDFIGMASDDVPIIVSIIGGGDIGAFRTIPDRMCQGFLNMIFVTRMMRGAFAKDPAVQFNGKSAIDTTTSYYFGGSEGGILGATFMAVTPDILRGGLEVAGQPYNLLLNRSVDYDIYGALIKQSYPNALDIQLLLGAVQMLWDRGEPTGYSKYIENDPLPGTPSHEVLLQLSLGDHQVSTLGGHIMARAIGLSSLKPAVRPIFGIDEIDAPHQGSALIEYDFGNAPDPITNVPPRDGEDPHGKMKGIPAAGQVLQNFLETGVVNQYCTDTCNPD